MAESTPTNDADSPLESCFVIGPIGDRLAAVGSEARQQYEQSMRIWDYVIYPACQAFGIEPIRADRIADPGEITDQIFKRLRDDDLVIADVSEGNANVMYELGLRHTRNKITIQIGEKERLPFDVTTIRTIQFNKTETGLVEAREQLQEAISASIERGPQPVTATRVWLELDDPVPEAVITTEIDDEDEGPGFLDMLAETEVAIPLLNEVAGELTTTFDSGTHNG